MNGLCLPRIKDADHERFIRTVCSNLDGQDCIALEAIEGLEYVTVTRSGITVVWKGLKGYNPAMQNCIGRSECHRYEVGVRYNDVLAWSRDNRLHREDGPAWAYPNSSQQRWYSEGRLHRLDGPAVINADGRKEWWIDGRWVK